MKQQKHAFTLIELLVVISIVSLLIAVLMPALSQARQTAIGLKCMAKIRQFGVAFAMYVSDQNGWYPAGYEMNPTTNSSYADYSPDCPAPDGSWDNGWTWCEAVYDYLKQPGAYNGIKPHKGRSEAMSLYRCPADRNQILSGVNSYTMNSQRSSSLGTHDGMTFETWNSETELPLDEANNNRTLHVNERWVYDPSGTFILVDAAALQSDIYRLSWRYLGGAKIRAPLYGTSPRMYCYDQTGSTYKFGVHNKAYFNWLMVDGHAARLSAEDTIGSGSLSNPKGIWTKVKGD